MTVGLGSVLVLSAAEPVGSTTPSANASRPQERIHAAMLQTYVHGVDDALAERVVGAEGRNNFV